MMKNLFFASLIILFISQCKTTKIATSSDNKAPDMDTLTVADSIKKPIEDTTTYYITQNGDTLDNLESVVAKEVFTVHKDTITIAAVGDIMMGTNFPSTSYLPADNGDKLWSAVSQTLQTTDLTFGNLEGTILDEGGEQKECNNPKACYLFRTPEYLSYHFKKHGFDLLSLANNHANDFGPTGRKNTQRVLDSLDILHAGSENVPFSILKRKGYTIGFLAMAPNKGTISIHNEEFASETIKHLDTLTDIVIVSLHIGAEGSKNENLTRKREFYYGEDRGNVYDLSRLLIDNGADLIIGHGPHVVRAVDIYKDKFIAYSLGNFLTYGRFNLRGANAYAPVLKLKLSPSGDFIEGEIESFIQDYALGPIEDPMLRASKKIKELTENDIPESQLLIEESGKIGYLKHSK